MKKEESDQKDAHLVLGGGLALATVLVGAFVGGDALAHRMSLRTEHRRDIAMEQEVHNEALARCEAIECPTALDCAADAAADFVRRKSQMRSHFVSQPRTQRAREQRLRNLSDSRNGARNFALRQHANMHRGRD